jgi:hypothetical protein
MLGCLRMLEPLTLAPFRLLGEKPLRQEQNDGDRLHWRDEVLRSRQKVDGADERPVLGQ